MHRCSLVLLLSLACARLPVSPTPPTLPLVIGAGQSNAVALFTHAAFLSKFAVAGSWQNARKLSAWAPDGDLWPMLQYAATAAPLAKAFIVWEGEADVLAPLYGDTPTPNWDVAFASLVARVRMATGNPTLPVIIIEFGPGYLGSTAIGPDPPAYRYRTSAVWMALQAFAASDPHAVLLPTEDLTFDSDGTHAFAHSDTYATIATRLRTIVDALPTPTITPPPPPPPDSPPPPDPPPVVPVASTVVVVETVTRIVDALTDFRTHLQNS